MARRLIGAVLSLFGAWLTWLPAYPAWLYMDRGGPVLGTVLDPVFLIPLLRGVLATLGGLLALNGLRFGAWATGASAVISAALGVLFLAMGQGAVPFVPHLAYAAILVAATVGLILLPRQSNGA